MGGIGDWLFGSEDKLQKVDSGTKEQMQFGGKDLIGLLQKMMQQGGGLNQANQYDQSLLGQGPEALNQFSQPYLQQFQEQILPMIAERFAGGGALSSSGFGQAVGGAGAGLQAKLAELFSQLQGQAAGRQQGQFQGLSSLGLGYQPFQYQQKQGSAGAIGPLLGGIGTAIGGPIGGALGGGIASLFKRRRRRWRSSWNEFNQWHE